MKDPCDRDRPRRPAIGSAQPASRPKPPTIPEEGSAMHLKRRGGAMSPRRARRPFNALAALGAAGHNGFERWAGIGVFLEPWLGRRATDILWSVAIPTSFVRALV